MNESERAEPLNHEHFENFDYYTDYSKTPDSITSSSQYTNNDCMMNPGDTDNNNNINGVSNSSQKTNCKEASNQQVINDTEWLTTTPPTSTSTAPTTATSTASSVASTTTTPSSSITPTTTQSPTNTNNEVQPDDTSSKPSTLADECPTKKCDLPSSITTKSPAKQNASKKIIKSKKVCVIYIYISLFVAYFVSHSNIIVFFLLE